MSPDAGPAKIHAWCSALIRRAAGAWDTRSLPDDAIEINARRSDGPAGCAFELDGLRAGLAMG